MLKEKEIPYSERVKRIYSENQFDRDLYFLKNMPGINSGDRELLSHCLSCQEGFDISAKSASKCLGVSQSAVYRRRKNLIDKKLLIKNFRPNLEEIEKWEIKINMFKYEPKKSSHQKSESKQNQRIPSKIPAGVKKTEPNILYTNSLNLKSNNIISHQKTAKNTHKTNPKKPKNKLARDEVFSLEFEGFFMWLKPTFKRFALAFPEKTIQFTEKQADSVKSEINHIWKSGFSEPYRWFLLISYLVGPETDFRKFGKYRIGFRGLTWSLKDFQAAVIWAKSRGFSNSKEFYNRVTNCGRRIDKEKINLEPRDWSLNLN